MEKGGMFCFIVGLLMTAFGVGGIEQSIETADLIAGIFLAALGCGVMACGVLMIKVTEGYYRNL